MKKIYEKIEKLLTDNNIKFLKKDKVFKMVYRGLKDKNNLISIYLSVSEDQKTIYFQFTENVNKKESLDIIKTKLLDLNSSLNSGNLSMRSNSDMVEYKLKYHINEAELSFENYNISIVKCICVYEEMQRKSII